MKRASEEMLSALAHWSICALWSCTRAAAPVSDSAPLAIPSASASPPAPGPAPAPAIEPLATPPLAAAPAASDAEMILVPGGPFRMGADHGGQDDERPEHEVTLPAFWLDRSEVTNAAYAACVAARSCRPHDPESARKNHFGSDAGFRSPEQPISSISWEDASAFCTFRGKRLPSEAEWEKAARGTDGRRYPWGNEPPDAERAVYAASRTLPVGSRPRGAGPYGHLDMAGNVWEWLADVYDPYAYRRPGSALGVGGGCSEALAAQDELRRAGKHGFTGSNPIPSTCERVLRGGAFNYDGPGLRSSNRVHHPPHFRLIMSGARCAKSG